MQAKAECITWSAGVHMIETMEASDFLEGGEIAFTTGLGLSSRVPLLTLINTYIIRRPQESLSNTGPFIEKFHRKRLISAMNTISLFL